MFHIEIKLFQKTRSQNTGLWYCMRAMWGLMIESDKSEGILAHTQKSTPCSCGSISVRVPKFAALFESWF